MAADELHQLFFAHGIGSAFGSDRLFELGGFSKVVHELLLNRAAAGDMNRIRVHQMGADLFEILLNQGFFQIVRGVLARIGPRTWILGMTEDGEGGAVGAVTDDGRVMSVQPHSEILFGFF